MELTQARWDALNDYMHAVFGDEDAQLGALMPAAIAQGMPDIAVNAEVGRLLMILTAMTRGRCAIEVGTLGGYSGIWIARGLRPGGRLITIEINPDHAAFAREQFERAGVSDRVEIRCADAHDALTNIAAEMTPGSIDVVFLDADKESYPDYWSITRLLIAPGGLIIADNCFSSSAWFITDEGHPARDAADRFNRLVASDDDFEAVGLPIRQGVLVGRRCD